MGSQGQLTGDNEYANESYHTHSHFVSKGKNHRGLDKKQKLNSKHTLIPILFRTERITGVWIRNMNLKYT